MHVGSDTNEREYVGAGIKARADVGADTNARSYVSDDTNMPEKCSLVVMISSIMIDDFSSTNVNEKCYRCL